MKKQVSLKELGFLENILFSLSEEIDIFYALSQNADLFEETLFTEDLLQDKLIKLVDNLENLRSGPKYTKSLQQIYIISMGYYKLNDRLEIKNPTVNLKKHFGNRMICRVTGLNLLSQNLKLKMQEMQQIDMTLDKEQDFPQRLYVEQEIRMFLNILINYILCNINHDEGLWKEVVAEDSLIEEMCFKSIKYSLEIPVIPIRKFLILFYLYLRILFGDVPQTKEEHKDLKYMKELQNLIEKEDPRYHMKNVSNVEGFYKRHMNSDSPIPQIIVVGILRVLLTTCPNAARNTGGIDLHSEWSSPLQFAFYKRDYFIAHNFQSQHFNHDFLQIPAQNNNLNQDNIEQEEGSSTRAQTPRKEAPDFAIVEDYKYENDRHRVIVALIISDFFLFLMKHFKNNHIIQFIYISQLVVDANGVLVLLKFLNQDFTKIDFSSVKIDQKYPFIYDEGSQLQLEQILELSINSLLRLMYKTCKNQGERIKLYLVQYKAALIMKRLINKFEKSEVADIKKNAGKIIKIQIKYMNRNWRKNNMKIVSLVYQFVKLRRLDDWLAWENQSLEEELYLSQDEIRHMNLDFNYKHYSQFIEKIEEDKLKLTAAQNGIELAEDGTMTEEEKEALKQLSKTIDFNKLSQQKDSEKFGIGAIIESGLEKAVDENNILHQLWKRANVEESFYKNYEKWLEEEVWSYYD
eukprot:403355681